MKVSIRNLPESGISLLLEEKSGAFPILVEMIKNKECDITAPIKIQLFLKQVKDMFHANGRIETIIRIPCSRCLNPYDTFIQDNFSFSYTDNLEGMEADSDEQEKELKVQDMDIVLFKGDEIDFRDSIQEQIILAFPMRPLCRKNCRGLCPNCGSDLNKGECGCTKTPVNSRFKILEKLKIQ